MTHNAENDAPKCGHTARPCTDARTWCPDCGTPPCCHHIATCRHARFDDRLSVIPPDLDDFQRATVEAFASMTPTQRRAAINTPRARVVPPRSRGGDS